MALRVDKMLNIVTNRLRILIFYASIRFHVDVTLCGNLWEPNLSCSRLYLRSKSVSLRQNFVYLRHNFVKLRHNFQYFQVSKWCYQYFQVPRWSNWFVFQYFQVLRLSKRIVFQYFQVPKWSNWFVFQYFHVPRNHIREDLHNHLFPRSQNPMSDLKTCNFI